MTNNETRALFRQKWQYALRRAGYQQQQIAHLLNVDATTLSKWVNGRTPWPHDALTRACELLELQGPAKHEMFALAGYEAPTPIISLDPAIAPEPRVPFMGLLPYRFTDADLFFGRDQAIDSLLAKVTVEHTRLLVINGLSGVGKTSLLRAGLVPRLRGLGCAVVYCQILDSPKSDVLRGIYTAFDLLPGAAAVGLVEAIDAISLIPPRPIVLVIDQLERCLSAAQREAENFHFWSDLARLIGGESHHDVQIILAVRSDWLHAFQSVPLNVPVFDFLYLLRPLTLDEARKALIGPLEYFGIAHEPGLIDEVVNDLAYQKESVSSPELQIVGLALYRHGRQTAAHEPRMLTFTDYRSLQGARAIIRNHLVNTVNNLGPSAQECWQVLLRLVGPENQRVSKQTEELRGNLAPDDFERIVVNLERAHLVTRHISARDNRPVYTLTHDYLVEELNKYVEQDLRLQAWRTAGHYLEQGLVDWRAARQTEAPELLLERARYRYIWAQRAGFGPLTAEAYRLLLTSALAHGEESFAYWLECMPQEFLPAALEMVCAAVVDDTQDHAEAARQAITRAVRGGLLGDETGMALRDTLWPAFQAVHKSLGGDANGAKPQSARSSPARHSQETAAILWALRRYSTPAEQATIAPAAARHWLHRHRKPLWSALISAVTVILLVAAAWWFNRGLHGEWRTANTLIAGPINALALSPVEPKALYAVVPRGPNIGDGAALVKRAAPGQGWTVLSRSLTYLPVSDMMIAPFRDGVRIYLSVHGKGIERSDDGGVTWQLSNTGLFSYDIRTLAVHPQHPELLYAGSGDAKGVFRTADGGDSWHDVSGPQLFGASVLTLAYTPYGGGKWLAGTADGRIVMQGSDDVEWRPVSIFPGAGAIVTLAVEAQNGREVYAGTSTGLVSVSLDGGEHWVVADKIPGVFGVNSIGVVPGRGEQVFMSAYGVGGNIVWQSEDFGQSWQPTGDSNFTREPVRLFSHPREARKWYAAGAPGLFETMDNGQSWVYQGDLPAPIVRADRIAISVLEDGPTYVATGGAVFSSYAPQDGGWTRGRGLPAVVVRDVAVDPGDAGRAYAGVYLPNLWSIFTTGDGGATWTSTALPATIPQKYLNDTMAISAVRAGNDLWLYAGTNGCGVLFSPDGGHSWETFDREDCVLPVNTPKSVIDLTVAPSMPQKVFAAADSTRVYASEDQGRTWSVTKLDISTPIFALAADSRIDDRVYLIAGADGFWRSDDGAQQWERLSVGLHDKILTAMVALPGLPETLFVAASNGEVWKTTDGGKRWRPVTENLAISRAGALAYDARHHQVVLGAELDGLFWYREGTWFPRSR